MELVSLYPYDPTARATSNKIVNESITVIPPSQVTDYSYVVPRAAPFFAETLVVKDGKGVGARTLVENVDYWCVIDFLSASVGLTKRVSVGIALLDPNYSGTLYVSYQTLGGNYTMADYSVLEELIRERYVVKHVSYEQIINLPAGFSPEWHSHEVADMVGMSSVVTSLNNIKVATESRNGSYGQIEQQLRNHVNSTAAHTPVDIGLGNVKNYGVATLTDAKGGSVSKYITADILKQYVAFEKNDVSGFLSKSDASLTYQTIANMSNYYDKTTSDGRYVYKSDTYTKLQIDGLINDIDVSSSLGNYYTKSQADGRYLAKTDLDGYSSTLVADGKYATKLALNSYYTKVDADGRFALKAQSYTKGESDGRYLSSTALSGYLTQSVADGRYQTKTAMDNYYTKAESNRENLILTYDSTPDGNIQGDYVIKYSQTHANNVTSVKEIELSMPKHAKKSEVYTKSQVDALVKLSTTVNSVKYSVMHGWFNYDIPMLWEISQVGSVFYLSAKNSTSFYCREAPFWLSSNPTRVLPATSTTVNIRPATLSMNLGSSDNGFNYFLRLNEPNVYMNKSTGDITIPLYFNYDNNDRVTYVAPGMMFVSISIVATDKAMYDSLSKLVNKSGNTTFTP